MLTKLKHEASLFGPGYRSWYRDSLGGWTARGPSPGGEARFPALVQIGPGAHIASCAIRTCSLPRRYNGQGVALTTPSL
jgi:hypothetical protein